MNGRAICTVLATCATLAIVAVMFDAASSGEAAKNKLGDVCDNAVWPMIPPTCFGRQ